MERVVRIRWYFVGFIKTSPASAFADLPPSKGE